MALHIRDPEAQRLARELAQATGDTMTGAVIKGLQMRLQQELSRRNERAARLMEHGKRFAALPVLDTRTPDQIIGHDEGSEARG